MIMARGKGRAVYVSVVLLVVAVQYLTTLVVLVKKTSDMPESNSSSRNLQRLRSRDDIETFAAEETAYSPAVEQLELLDFRTCRPPEGIPQYCCLGSASFGGEVAYYDHKCLNNPDDMLLPYQKVQNLTASFLQQHPLPPGTSRQCDACQIVHTLLQRNLSLAFLGDSMVRQNVVGLECELRRRGYSVTTELQAEEEFEKAHYRYQWSSTYHITVVHGTQQTTIRFFQMFRPSPPVMEEILRRYQIDALVFDHALHYRAQTELELFQHETELLLELLRDRVPLKVWREASTQHFDSDGGHFAPAVETAGCFPLNETDETTAAVYTNVMNDTIQAMKWTYTDATAADFATRAGDTATELVVIPFRDFTRPLDGMHPTANDCSHYCSTPYLWLPIWRPLRLALDRQVQRLAPTLAVDA